MLLILCCVLSDECPHTTRKTHGYLPFSLQALWVSLGLSSVTVYAEDINKWKEPEKQTLKETYDFTTNKTSVGGDDYFAHDHQAGSDSQH